MLSDSTVTPLPRNMSARKTKATAEERRKQKEKRDLQAAKELSRLASLKLTKKQIDKLIKTEPIDEEYDAAVQQPSTSAASFSFRQIKQEDSSDDDSKPSTSATAGSRKIKKEDGPKQLVRFKTGQPTKNKVVKKEIEFDSDTSDSSPVDYDVDFKPDYKTKYRLKSMKKYKKNIEEGKACRGRPPGRSRSLTVRSSTNSAAGPSTSDGTPRQRKETQKKAQTPKTVSRKTPRFNGDNGAPKPIKVAEIAPSPPKKKGRLPSGPTVHRPQNSDDSAGPRNSNHGESKRMEDAKIDPSQLKKRGRLPKDAEPKPMEDAKAPPKRPGRPPKSSQCSSNGPGPSSSENPARSTQRRGRLPRNQRVRLSPSFDDSADSGDVTRRPVTERQIDNDVAGPSDNFARSTPRRATARRSQSSKSSADCADDKPSTSDGQMDMTGSSGSIPAPSIVKKKKKASKRRCDVLLLLDALPPYMLDDCLAELIIMETEEEKEELLMKKKKNVKQPHPILNCKEEQMNGNQQDFEDSDQPPSLTPMDSFELDIPEPSSSLSSTGNAPQLSAFFHVRDPSGNGNLNLEDHQAVEEEDPDWAAGRARTIANQERIRQRKAERARREMEEMERREREDVDETLPSCSEEPQFDPASPEEEMMERVPPSTSSSSSLALVLQAPSESSHQDEGEESDGAETLHFDDFEDEDDDEQPIRNVRSVVEQTTQMIRNIEISERERERYAPIDVIQYEEEEEFVDPGIDHEEDMMEGEDPEEGHADTPSASSHSEFTPTSHQSSAQQNGTTEIHMSHQEEEEQDDERDADSEEEHDNQSDETTLSAFNSEFTPAAHQSPAQKINLDGIEMSYQAVEMEQKQHDESDEAGGAQTSEADRSSLDPLTAPIDNPAYSVIGLSDPKSPAQQNHLTDIDMDNQEDEMDQEKKSVPESDSTSSPVIKTPTSSDSSVQQMLDEATEVMEGAEKGADSLMNLGKEHVDEREESFEPLTGTIADPLVLLLNLPESCTTMVEEVDPSIPHCSTPPIADSVPELEQDSTLMSQEADGTSADKHVTGDMACDQVLDVEEAQVVAELMEQDKEHREESSPENYQEETLSSPQSHINPPAQTSSDDDVIDNSIVQVEEPSTSPFEQDCAVMNQESGNNASIDKDQDMDEPPVIIEAMEEDRDHKGDSASESNQETPENVPMQDVTSDLGDDEMINDQVMNEEVIKESPVIAEDMDRQHVDESNPAQSASTDKVIEEPCVQELTKSSTIADSVEPIHDSDSGPECPETMAPNGHNGEESSPNTIREPDVYEPSTSSTVNDVLDEEVLEPEVVEHPVVVEDMEPNREQHMPPIPPQITPLNVSREKRDSILKELLEEMKQRKDILKKLAETREGSCQENATPSRSSGIAPENCSSQSGGSSSSSSVMSLQDRESQSSMEAESEKMEVLEAGGEKADNENDEKVVLPEEEVPVQILLGDAPEHSMTPIPVLQQSLAPELPMGSVAVEEIEVLKTDVAVARGSSSEMILQEPIHLSAPILVSAAELMEVVETEEPEDASENPPIHSPIYIQDLALSMEAAEKEMEVVEADGGKADNEPDDEDDERDPEASPRIFQADAPEDPMTPTAILHQVLAPELPMRSAAAEEIEFVKTDEAEAAGSSSDMNLQEPINLLALASGSAAELMEVVETEVADYQPNKEVVEQEPEASHPTSPEDDSENPRIPTPIPIQDYALQLSMGPAAEEVMVADGEEAGGSPSLSAVEHLQELIHRSETVPLEHPVEESPAEEMEVPKACGKEDPNEEDLVPDEDAPLEILQGVAPGPVPDQYLAPQSLEADGKEAAGSSSSSFMEDLLETPNISVSTSRSPAAQSTAPDAPEDSGTTAPRDSEEIIEAAEEEMDVDNVDAEEEPNEEVVLEEPKAQPQVHPEDAPEKPPMPEPVLQEDCVSQPAEPEKMEVLETNRKESENGAIQEIVLEEAFETPPIPKPFESATGEMETVKSNGEAGDCSSSSSCIEDLLESPISPASTPLSSTGPATAPAEEMEIVEDQTSPKDAPEDPTTTAPVRHQDSEEMIEAAEEPMRVVEAAEHHESSSSSWRSAEDLQEPSPILALEPHSVTQQAEGLAEEMEIMDKDEEQEPETTPQISQDAPESPPISTPEVMEAEKADGEEDDQGHHEDSSSFSKSLEDHQETSPRAEDVIPPKKMEAVEADGEEEPNKEVVQKEPSQPWTEAAEDEIKVQEADDEKGHCSSSSSSMKDPLDPPIAPASLSRSPAEQAAGNMETVEDDEIVLQKSEASPHTPSETSSESTTTPVVEAGEHHDYSSSSSRSVEDLQEPSSILKEGQKIIVDAQEHVVDPSPNSSTQILHEDHEAPGPEVVNQNEAISQISSEDNPETPPTPTGVPPQDHASQPSVEAAEAEEETEADGKETGGSSSSSSMESIQKPPHIPEPAPRSPDEEVIAPEQMKVLEADGGEVPNEEVERKESEVSPQDHPKDAPEGPPTPTSTGEGDACQEHHDCSSSSSRSVDELMDILAQAPGSLVQQAEADGEEDEPHEEVVAEQEEIEGEAAVEEELEKNDVVEAGAQLNVEQEADNEAGRAVEEGHEMIVEADDVGVPSENVIAPSPSSPECDPPSAQRALQFQAEIMRTLQGEAPSRSSLENDPEPSPTMQQYPNASRVRQALLDAATKIEVEVEERNAQNGVQVEKMMVENLEELPQDNGLEDIEPPSIPESSSTYPTTPSPSMEADDSEEELFPDPTEPFDEDNPDEVLDSSSPELPETKESMSKSVKKQSDGHDGPWYQMTARRRLGRPRGYLGVYPERRPPRDAVQILTTYKRKMEETDDEGPSTSCHRPIKQELFEEDPNPATPKSQRGKTTSRGRRESEEADPPYSPGGSQSKGAPSHPPELFHEPPSWNLRPRRVRGEDGPGTSGTSNLSHLLSISAPFSARAIKQELDEMVDPSIPTNQTKSRRGQNGVGGQSRKRQRSDQRDSAPRHLPPTPSAPMSSHQLDQQPSSSTSAPGHAPTPAVPQSHAAPGQPSSSVPAIKQELDEVVDDGQTTSRKRQRANQEDSALINLPPTPSASIPSNHHHIPDRQLAPTPALPQNPLAPAPSHHTPPSSRRRSDREETDGPSTSALPQNPAAHLAPSSAPSLSPQDPLASPHHPEHNQQSPLRALTTPAPSSVSTPRTPQSPYQHSPAAPIIALLQNKYVYRAPVPSHHSTSLQAGYLHAPDHSPLSQHIPVGNFAPSSHHSAASHHQQPQDSAPGGSRAHAAPRNLRATPSAPIPSNHHQHNQQPSSRNHRPLQAGPPPSSAPAPFPQLSPAPPIAAFPQSPFAHHASALPPSSQHSASLQPGPSHIPAPLPQHAPTPGLPYSPVPHLSPGQLSSAPSTSQQNFAPHPQPSSSNVTSRQAGIPNAQLIPVAHYSPLVAFPQSPLVQAPSPSPSPQAPHYSPHGLYHGQVMSPHPNGPHQALSPLVGPILAPRTPRTPHSPYAHPNRSPAINVAPIPSPNVARPPLPMCDETRMVRDRIMREEQIAQNAAPPVGNPQERRPSATDELLDWYITDERLREARTEADNVIANRINALSMFEG
ncbi:hypothetical protein GCK72_016922 [Caenorhabditis remanei]|uniref:Uncharacterized protein n=1 Tax=Caenorhabditis remanei TaxID=31234 RepID=A0A6A5G6E3_CAERE|nr:hypothetical protein GCK72_016922 [Caenorhabditis remanei]KAF1750373.1 hypothetical protein GCK72_016922 [Caenorhabditis remanei]